MARLRRGAFAALAITTVLAAQGCEKEARVRGQLMISFQTDMAIPRQIDSVRVTATLSGGQNVLNDTFAVGTASNPNLKPLPGTLSLVGDFDPSPALTVRVLGSREADLRTFREAVVGIPGDRIAELRMPIQWLCSDMARYVSESVPGGKTLIEPVSDCTDGTTCKAGTCQPSMISGPLPTFEPENTFGGAADPKEGECFDTIACMAPGSVVEPDDDCTIAAPDGETDNFNVGLRVAGAGICDTQLGADTMCIVPLDGESDEGFRFDAARARLKLPPAVCERIADRKLVAVYASSACRTKTSALPPCGDWSSIPVTHAIQPSDEVSAAAWPNAELVATLELSDATLSCPLMSGSGKLYTCARSGTDSVTLFDIDGSAPQMRSVTLPERPSLASAVVGQVLYWATKQASASGPLSMAHIHSLPMAARGGGPTTIDAPGGVYTDGSLLADESGLYVLTSGLGADPPVRLLRFANTGSLTLSSIEPIGDSVIPQFAQDARALYVGSNKDVDVAGGTTQRTSSVVRIDKASAGSSELLTHPTLAISDTKHHGYLGMVSDGTTLFALFESERDAAGLEHLRIERVADAADASSGTPDPIFDLEVSADLRVTTLVLLGAVDGAVVFVREDREADLQTVRSSSVIIIPAGGTNRHYVGDLVGTALMPGVGVTDDAIFWLTQTGRLFSLPRRVLSTP